MAVQGHAVAGGAGLKMKVAFRADASLQIGTGHVMRCLTLADALAARRADCQFICRAHEGKPPELPVEHSGRARNAGRARARQAGLTGPHSPR